MVPGQQVHPAWGWGRRSDSAGVGAWRHRGTPHWTRHPLGAPILWRTAHVPSRRHETTGLRKKPTSLAALFTEPRHVLGGGDGTRRPGSFRSCSRAALRRDPHGMADTPGSLTCALLRAPHINSAGRPRSRTAHGRRRQARRVPDWQATGPSSQAVDVCVPRNSMKSSARSHPQ